jgi:hypothetical protein
MALGLCSSDAWAAEPIVEDEEAEEATPAADVDAEAEKKKLAAAERRRNAKPPPEPPRPRFPGVSLRLGYRRFQLAEVVTPTQTLENDTFQVAVLDVYPVSDVMRFGLSLQGGISDDDDWLGQVGLVLGVQWPGLPVTPFAEIGSHAGLVRRSIWPMENPEPTDFPAMLLELNAEAGIDIHLGRVIVTVSGGFQRGWFTIEESANNHAISFQHTDSWYLKFGIGY